MVVQVVTDTCSVMKAAWKLVETKFPWITCTCCGPHVLNLYLKDLGKIEEVAAVIKKSNAILNLFWGKKRWPRTKLREVIAVNHKKEFGLYRPKATRFAGNMRALGRMLCASRPTSSRSSSPPSLVSRSSRRATTTTPPPAPSPAAITLSRPSSSTRAASGRRSWRGSRLRRRS